MNQQRRLAMIVYTIADFLSAMAAWACFFLYRKWFVEGTQHHLDVLNDPKFSVGIFIIPVGWVLFYALFDKYKDIYRLARVDTFTRTFFLSFVGVFFLFFTLVLDDFVTDYTTY